MFTGIITEVGEIIDARDEQGWRVVQVSGPKTAARVLRGSSVAINGVCLTVQTIAENGSMQFSILPQTLAVTLISNWQPGTKVNLENALRVGDELGGHFVYGHVDGTATVVAVTQEGESTRIRMTLPPELHKFTAPRGSISINGTSLTIAERGDAYIEVALVAYTLLNTTLGELKVGDAVHVECDMLLKFIAQAAVH